MAGITQETAGACVDAIRDNKEAVRKEAKGIAMATLTKYRENVKNNVYKEETGLKLPEVFARLSNEARKENEKRHGRS